ncbi:hypothetical protein PR048_019777 [Dryococelus australis]|uniref:Uncharacterized protein n=1 Tax=Dryococelus australis TaxID=614101 RepID=A0ABQ9H4P6_9NEOP|nr:hypothetical protein PR048_019777 [Dryococelus australis]
MLRRGGHLQGQVNSTTPKTGREENDSQRSRSESNPYHIANSSHATQADSKRVNEPRIDYCTVEMLHLFAGALDDNLLRRGDVRMRRSCALATHPLTPPRALTRNDGRRSVSGRSACCERLGPDTWENCSRRLEESQVSPRKRTLHPPSPFTTSSVSLRQSRRNVASAPIGSSDVPFDRADSNGIDKSNRLLLFFYRLPFPHTLARLQIALQSRGCLRWTSFVNFCPVLRVSSSCRGQVACVHDFPRDRHTENEDRRLPAEVEGTTAQLFSERENADKPLFLYRGSSTTPGLHNHPFDPSVARPSVDHSDFKWGHSGSVAMSNPKCEHCGPLARPIPSWDAVAQWLEQYSGAAVAHRTLKAKTRTRALNAKTCREKQHQKHHPPANTWGGYLHNASKIGQGNARSGVFRHQCSSSANCITSQQSATTGLPTHSRVQLHNMNDPQPVRIVVSQTERIPTFSGQKHKNIVEFLDQFQTASEINGWNETEKKKSSVERQSEVSMEQRRNAKAGETENPQENPRPVTSFRTSPKCENPGATQPGIEPGKVKLVRDRACGGGGGPQQVSHSGLVAHKLAAETRPLTIADCVADNPHSPDHSSRPFTCACVRVCVVNHEQHQRQMRAAGYSQQRHVEYLARGAAWERWNQLSAYGLGRGNAHPPTLRPYPPPPPTSPISHALNAALHSNITVRRLSRVVVDCGLPCEKMISYLDERPIPSRADPSVTSARPASASTDTGDSERGELGTSPECKGGGNWRSPRKATGGIVWHDSHMLKSGATPPGIEPDLPWWEASSLTTTLPWLRQLAMICVNHRYFGRSRLSLSEAALANTSHTYSARKPNLELFTINTSPRVRRVRRSILIGGSRRAERFCRNGTPEMAHTRLFPVEENSPAYGNGRRVSHVQNLDDSVRNGRVVVTGCARITEAQCQSYGIWVDWSNDETTPAANGMYDNSRGVCIVLKPNCGLRFIREKSVVLPIVYGVT